MSERQSTTPTATRRVYVTVLVTVLAVGLTMSGLWITAVAAEEPDPIPASYYGALEINGEPAPAGVTIEAEINGTVVGSITLEDDGAYGAPEAGEPKLEAAGSAEDVGEPVEFYVVGSNFERTPVDSTSPASVSFEAADHRQIDMSVSVELQAGDEPTGEADTDDDNNETAAGQQAGGQQQEIDTDDEEVNGTDVESESESESESDEETDADEPDAGNDADENDGDDDGDDTDGGETAADDDSEGEDTESDDTATASDESPGPGIVGSLAVILGAAVLLRRVK